MKEQAIVSTETNNTTLAGVSDYMQERLLHVARDLMVGLSPITIAKKYADEWNVSTSTIRVYYVKEARKIIREELLTDETDIREDLLAKYSHLYMLNMKNGDFKEARQILDSVSKLTQTLVSNVTVMGNIQTINLVEVIREDDGSTEH